MVVMGERTSVFVMTWMRNASATDRLQRFMSVSFQTYVPDILTEQTRYEDISFLIKDEEGADHGSKNGALSRTSRYGGLSLHFHVSQQTRPP